MATVAEEILRFIVTGDVDDARNAFKLLLGDLDGLEEKAGKHTKGAGQSFQDFGKTVQHVISETTAAIADFSMKMGGIFATLTAGIAFPTKVFGDYEQEIQKFSAASEASAGDLEKFKAAALETGKATEYSAKQAAEAGTAMAKLGFNTTQAIASMPGVINLAAAASVSLASAAGISTGVLKSFNLEASKSGYVADILAKTVSKTAADFTGMAEAMKYAGPAAQAAKIPLAETSAILGLMADKMIDGSTAGTSFRASVLRLQNPTKEMKEVMKALNVELTYGKDGSLKLTDMMLKLQKGLGGLKTDTKNAAIQTLFGTEAFSAMAAVLETSPERIKSFSKEIQNATGFSRQMAEEMRKGLNFAIEQLKGSIETFAITMGQSFAPTIIMLAGWLQVVVDWLTATPKWVKDIAAQFMLWGAALTGILTIGGGILVFLGAMVNSIMGLKTAFTLLNELVFLGPMLSAIGSAATGFMATLLPLIALAGALYLAWSKNLGGIQDIMIPFFESVQMGLSDLQGWLSEAGASWDGVWQGIKETFFSVVGILDIGLRGLFDTINFVFQVISDVMVGNWSGAWKSIVNVLSSGAGIVLKATGEFFGKMADLFKKAWSGLSEIASGAWDVIANPRNATAGLSRMASGATSVMSAVGDMGSGIKDGWDKTIDGIYEGSRAIEQQGEKVMNFNNRAADSTAKTQQKIREEHKKTTSFVDNALNEQLKGIMNKDHSAEQSAKKAAAALHKSLSQAVEQTGNISPERINAFKSANKTTVSLDEARANIGKVAEDFVKSGEAAKFASKGLAAQYDANRGMGGNCVLTANAIVQMSGAVKQLDGVMGESKLSVYGWGELLKKGYVEVISDLSKVRPGDLVRSAGHGGIVTRAGTSPDDIQAMSSFNQGGVQKGGIGSVTNTFATRNVEFLRFTEKAFKDQAKMMDDETAKMMIHLGDLEKLRRDRNAEFATDKEAALKLEGKINELRLALQKKFNERYQKLQQEQEKLNAKIQDEIVKNVADAAATILEIEQGTLAAKIRLMDANLDELRKDGGKEEQILQLRKARLSKMAVESAKSFADTSLAMAKELSEMPRIDIFQVQTKGPTGANVTKMVREVTQPLTDYQKQIQAAQQALEDFGNETAMLEQQGASIQVLADRWALHNERLELTNDLTNQLMLKEADRVQRAGLDKVIQATDLELSKRREQVEVLKDDLGLQFELETMIQRQIGNMEILISIDDKNLEAKKRKTELEKELAEQIEHNNFLALTGVGYVEKAVKANEALASALKSANPITQLIFTGLDKMASDLFTNAEESLKFKKGLAEAVPIVGSIIGGVGSLVNKMGDLDAKGKKVVSVLGDLAGGVASAISGDIPGAISSIFGILVTGFEDMQRLFFGPTREELMKLQIESEDMIAKIQKFNNEIAKSDLNIAKLLGKVTKEEEIELRLRIDKDSVQTDIDKLKKDILRFMVNDETTKFKMGNELIDLHWSETEASKLFDPKMFNKVQEHLSGNAKIKFAEFFSLIKKQQEIEAQAESDRSKIEEEAGKETIKRNDETMKQVREDFAKHQEETFKHEQEGYKLRIELGDEATKAKIESMAEGLEKELATLDEAGKQEKAKMAERFIGFEADAEMKGILSEQLAAITVRTEEKKSEAVRKFNAEKDKTIAKMESERALLQAQLTSDPFDDIYAERQQSLAELDEAEKESLAKYGQSEADKAKIVAFYADKRRKILFDADQKVIEINKKAAETEKQKQEELFKLQIEKQNTLKKLAEEEFKLATEKYEVEKRRLETDKATIQKDIDRLEEQKRKLAEDKAAANKEASAQAKSRFKELQDSVDLSKELREGLSLISNPTRTNEITGTTAGTKDEAMQRYLEFLKLQAENARDLRETKEGIAYGPADFNKDMEKVALLRAKFAQFRLKNEKMGKEQTEKIRREEANAFLEFQELEKAKIDEKYLDEETKINESIENNKKRQDVIEDSIRVQNNSISDLKIAYDATTKGIDANIEAMTAKHDGLAKQMGAVGTSFQQASDSILANWNKMQTEFAKGINIPINGQPSAGGSYSSPSAPAPYSAYSDENITPFRKSYTPDNDWHKSFVVPGTDGNWYRTTDEMMKAAPHAADGFLTPPGHTGDTFPVVMTKSNEMITPMDRLGSMINEAVSNAAYGSRASAANITNIIMNQTISGNTISENVDMSNIAYNASKKALGEIAKKTSATLSHLD